MSFLRYYSLDAALDAGATQHMARLGEGDPHWWGGRDLPQAIAFLRAGVSDEAQELVLPALEMAERMDRDDPAQTWSRAVAGSIPDVPGFLAGVPDAMRTLASASQPPVTLVLMLSVPADVSTFAIERRAVLAAALALRWSEQRPVELWLADAARTDKDIGWAVRIDPSDHSHLLALCDPSGMRMFALNMLALAAGKCDRQDFDIACGGHYLRYSAQGYVNAVCRAFEFPPGSLVIPGGFKATTPHELLVTGLPTGEQACCA